jgi:hypothetical protein
VVLVWTTDIGNAARGLASPAALLRRCISMSSNNDSTRPAHPSSRKKLPKPDDTIEAHYASLERLEERYRHELLSDEERQDLRDRVIALRRRLGR